MTKLIKFKNRTKNYEKIYNFLKNIVNLSNNQRIKNERFMQLIMSVVSNTNNHESRTTLRKSYLISNHLQQDLKECDCENYIQIKHGKVIISPRFLIKTYIITINSF